MKYFITLTVLLLLIFSPILGAIPSAWAAPVISGLEDDPVPAKAKTWNWLDEATTTTLFRFIIDKTQDTVPLGEYGDFKTATQPDGDGVFYLHVQARDIDGVESGVTTVSAILDNTAPVIALAGDNPLTLEVFSAYNEPGVAVDDDSAVAIDSSAVNTSEPGLYTVTYDSSDTAGNSAVQVKRTVKVVDTTPPVIALTGDSAITLEAGETYIEPGATASDNYDGDLSAAIIIGGDSVNTNIPDIYTVTYNVKDSSNNEAVEASRTVNVVDTTAPALALVTPIPNLSGDNTPSLVFNSNEAGSIAYSGACGNGDIAEAISGDNTVQFSILADGEYSDCLITVTDTADNADSLDVNAFIIDTTAPDITGLADDPIPAKTKTWNWDSSDPAAEFRYSIDQDPDGLPGGSYGSTKIASQNSGDGTYFIHVQAKDGQGNESAVATVSTILDNTAPVISLAGDNPLTLEVFSTYNEPGANADDGSTVAIDSGAVNTSELGSYTVIYDSSDTAGNSSRVNRTVNIVDTTRPEIQIAGDNPLIHEAKTPYSDPGATASDNYDNDLTGNIVTVNNVNENATGTYYVTYDVVDSSNNAAVQAIRTVSVVDRTLPVITLNGESEMTLEVHSDFTDPGATAGDSYDGNISARIVIGGDMVATNTIGIYQIKYNVTDSSANAAAEVVRTVHIVDTTAPEITITGDNPITHEAKTPYSDPGARASDNYDGDISARIASTTDLNIDLLGTYSIVYTVSDENENQTSATRTVNVVDTTAPMITLIGSSMVTVERLANYEDPGAQATDNYDNDISAAITSNSNDVNTAVVGTTIIVYEVADSSNNSTSTTRTVVVQDTTAPRIEITDPIPNITNDDTPSFVFTSDEAGTIGYSGACFGDLSAAIIGANTVTYNQLATGTFSNCALAVTDDYGNRSATATLDEFIIDTEAPVAAFALKPAQYASSTQAIFTFKNGITNYRYYLDNGDFGAETDAADMIELNGLDEGEHKLYAIGRDAAGNWQASTTPTIYIWTVDITAPVISAVLDDGDTRDAKSYTWTWGASEANCQFRYSFSGPPTGDYDYIYYIEKIGENGTFQPRVQARDRAGNESEIALLVSVKLDNSAPYAQFNENTLPPKVTTDRTIDIQVLVPGGVKYRWKINYESWSSDISKTANITETLPPGDYTVYAVGGDALGNWQPYDNMPAEYSWTIEPGASGGGSSGDDGTPDGNIDTGANGSSGGGGGSSSGGGGSSGGSAKEPVKLSDTPITQPANISFADGIEYVKIAWNNPLTSRFKEVVIYRTNRLVSDLMTDEEISAISEVVYRGNGEIYIDNNFDDTKVYRYVILAYDFEGNNTEPYIVAARPGGNYVPTADDLEYLDIAPAEASENIEEPEVLGIEHAALENIDNLGDASSEVVEQVTGNEAGVIFGQNELATMDEAISKIFGRILDDYEGDISEQTKYAISYFIQTGTPTTKRLGAGERAGSLNSYLAAFGRWPESADDWKDVLKIANGRWPSKKSPDAEGNANIFFKKVYLRVPDMADPHDNAAVTVIAYGLRPAKRNMESEAAAIKTFKKIFRWQPSSAVDWDIVRAIAYSGAVR